MDKVQKHSTICTKLNKVYAQKNAAYGDAFGETFHKLGMISAVTRMMDKINRLQSLCMNPDIDMGDESMIDTCLDLANYAIMTVIELENHD